MVESDPVGAVLIVCGMLAFREYLMHLPGVVPVPGVVPPCTHVQVDGVDDVALHQAFDEKFEGDDLSRLYEAEASFFLAKGAVAGFVLTHSLPHRCLFPIEDDEILAECHLAGRMGGKEGGFVHETPFVTIPHESSCIGTAVVAFVPGSSTHMGISDVGVCERCLSLAGEGCFATEHHMGVAG